MWNAINPTICGMDDHGDQVQMAIMVHRILQMMTVSKVYSIWTLVFVLTLDACVEEEEKMKKKKKQYW